MSRRAWMLLLVLYALTFPGVYFGGNMQRAVVDTAAAIVEWGRLDIGALEPNTPDSAVFEGRYYSGMPPAASFLAVPVYAVAKIAWRVAPESLHHRIEAVAARRLAEKRAATGGTGHSLFATPFYKEQLLTHILLNILLGVGGGAVLFWGIARLAARLGDDDGGVLAAVAAMGSTALAFYAGAWYTQSIALACFLFALDRLFAVRRTWRTAFVGGFLAATAGAVDYPQFLFAGVAMLFAAFLPWNLARARARETVAAALGFAIPLAGVLLYHAACFGSPFETAYHHRAHSRHPVPGLQRMGIGDRSLVRAEYLIAGSREGLLWHAPIALLGIAGIALLARRRERVGDDDRSPLEAAMVTVVLLSTIHWLSTPWNSWEAAYGPRYFLTALTLLLLLAPRAGPWRRAFVATAVVGALINHLNLIGLDVTDAVAALLEGSPVGPREIVLFPLSLRFGVATGLVVDAAYLLALVGVAMVLRSSRGSRL